MELIRKNNKKSTILTSYLLSISPNMAKSSIPAFCLQKHAHTSQCQVHSSCRCSRREQRQCPTPELWMHSTHTPQQWHAIESSIWSELKTIFVVQFAHCRSRKCGTHRIWHLECARKHTLALRVRDAFTAVTSIWTPNFGVHENTHINDAHHQFSLDFIIFHFSHFAYWICI